MKYFPVLLFHLVSLNFSRLLLSQVGSFSNGDGDGDGGEDAG